MTGLSQDSIVKVPPITNFKHGLIAICTTLDFDITYGEGSGNTRTLYFEFETLEELETMYQSISDTNKFCVIKSPLDSDFKFKVKTNLLAQKSQKEIFRENLRKLNGVDFSVKVGDYEYVTIGKLVEKDSTMYNPQIQISAESETKRSIFREKDKTKRSKKESAQHSKSRNKSFVMTSVSAL